jgi:hypothetical protein
MKYGTFLADNIVVHNCAECFLPGSLISMTDGTFKPIEQIQIGDQVKVYNQKNKTIENAPVTTKQNSIHNDVYEIYLQDGTILQPTSNHPFLTREKGWATISGLDEMGLGAAQLDVGDHLYQTQTNGTLKTIQITNIIPIQGTYLTYNLVDMKTGTYLAQTS